MARQERDHLRAASGAVPKVENHRICLRDLRQRSVSGFFGDFEGSKQPNLELADVSFQDTYVFEPETVGDERGMVERFAELFDRLSLRGTRRGLHSQPEMGVGATIAEPRVDAANPCSVGLLWGG